MASLIISIGDLEYSGPLVYGTTQKLQNLSHPSCIVINEDVLESEFLIVFNLSNLFTTSKFVKFNLFFLWFIFCKIFGIF